MGGGHTSGDLGGHVSKAGGLGVIGASFVAPDESGDVDNMLMWFGQSAGLVENVLPAEDVVHQVAREAEEILRTALPALIAP